MSKFSEASTVSQISQILGLVAVFMTLFGAALFALADQQIDEKYATDEDLQAVQVTVAAQVTRIEETVTTNTKTVQATATSVDALVLSVLGLQISDLEEEIVDLERQKRADAAGWNERDETHLRDRQRSLADLELQRNALLQRLTAGPPQ